MELALLWLGINALIGYALGKPKNEVGASILICILLGPIGWLLCILNKGKLRKCPYCAEDVKPEAVVCRHCGRDLPQIPSRGPRPISPKRRKWEAIATVLVVLVVVGGMLLYAAMHKEPIPAKSPGLHSIPQNPATPEIRRAIPVQRSNADTAKLSSPTAEADRIDETIAMMRRVPHEKIKTWEIPGGGIGLDVLVKRGVTDAQLSDLVRTYQRNGARVIFIYDRQSDVQAHTPAYHWMSGNDDGIYEWRSWNENPRRVKESSR